MVFTKLSTVLAASIGSAGGVKMITKMFGQN
jgi:hypothetical protein